jgi:hypothetical protein
MQEVKKTFFTSCLFSSVALRAVAMANLWNCGEKFNVNNGTKLNKPQR